MRSVELIEECTLLLEACCACILLIKVGTQELLEFVEGFQTDALGKILINNCRRLALDRLDLDIEGGQLSGEICSLIVSREGHLDRCLISDLGTLKLLFEPGDKPP